MADELHGTFEPEVFQFSREELELFRQWYNSVRDVTPRYLEAPDIVLGHKVHEMLGKRYHAHPAEHQTKSRPRRY
jgi:hypothetical protein